MSKNRLLPDFQNNNVQATKKDGTKVQVVYQNDQIHKKKEFDFLSNYTGSEYKQYGKIIAYYNHTDLKSTEIKKWLTDIGDDYKNKIWS